MSTLLFFRQMTTSIFVFRANRSEKGSGKSGSGINDYVTSLFDQTLTWQDVQWLKQITNLPIVLKGILHPEDAKIGTYVRTR